MVLLSLFETPGKSVVELNQIVDEFSSHIGGKVQMDLRKSDPHVWTARPAKKQTRNDLDYHVFRLEENNRGNGVLISGKGDSLVLDFLDYFGTDYKYSESNFDGLGMLVVPQVRLFSQFPNPIYGVQHSREYRHQDFVRINHRKT